MKILQKRDALTNQCVLIMVCIQNFNNSLLCHRTDRLICHISPIFFKIGVDFKVMLVDRAQLMVSD